MVGVWHATSNSVAPIIVSTLFGFPLSIGSSALQGATSFPYFTSSYSHPNSREKYFTKNFTSGEYQ